MRLAYKDIAGGRWHIYQHEAKTLLSRRTPIESQLKELEGLGCVIIGTVRGNRVKRRTVRKF